MGNLKLDNHLTNQGLGTDGHEIAEYVENMKVWNDYVDEVNSKPIPGDEYDNPTDEWFNSRTLFADNLISEACNKLGWHSVPQSGGLSENFFPEEIKDWAAYYAKGTK